MARRGPLSSNSQGSGCGVVFLVLFGLAFTASGVAALFAKTDNARVVQVLVSLLFIAFGVGAIAMGLSRGRSPRSKLAPSGVGRFGERRFRRPKEPPRWDGGELVLRSSGKYKIGAIFIIVFALFWNGFIVPQFVRALGSGSYGQMAFMIPFMIGGLLLAALSVYSVLALFTPRPVVTVFARNGARLGGDLDLEWRFESRPRAFRRFRVLVEGIERASYTVGTDRHEATSAFVRAVLCDTTDEREMREGRASITLPTDAVPSFEAPNNGVVWRVVAKGEIPRMPDLNESWPFPVEPLEAQ